MELPPSFGLWLKERRKQLDLTQADLANCAGCSVMTIRKIEADERRPSRQIAELLAGCLDIIPEDHPVFLKAARAELRVDRLAKYVKTSNVNSPHAPAPKPALRLPTPDTPLLGREHELASLARLLRDPQCRLLTLVGLGGIGKTRLAIEAAANRGEAFTDGVYFISLAPINSAEFIIPAIASALDFTFYGPVDLATQLLNYLREKSMLLVLDNFEHLLPSFQAENEAGLDLLVKILHSAPAVKLLVTSRQRLHLHREWVFEVQGLPMPPPDHLDELETYSAAALFLQHARQTQADFVLTSEDRAAIGRICQLIAGMPLGLELAAAWVRVLSCREIAQEIERSLDFLAASARDIPERQRSLRLTFDHSWKLLSAEEQGVMRRLSVFRGGFRREAAERVAGATLPVLLALVDKSLLRRTDAHTGRYDLHELVRQYAATHLQQLAIEEDETRERHCDFFTRLLQQASTHLKSAEQGAALTELSTEVDNLRLAWAWAVRQRDTARLQQAAFGLFLFYLCRNWVQEGAELFQQAAEVFQTIVDSQSTPSVDGLATLGRLLAYQGWCRIWSGQVPLVREMATQNLALLRPLDAPAALSDALRVQGVLLQMMGDLAAARACLEESLTLKRMLGDEWEVAVSLTYLGHFVQAQGGHADAYSLLAEAAAIMRRYGDRISTARALGFLSASTLALGRHDEAGQLAQESLSISREINDPWGMANVLIVLGIIAQAQADASSALSFFRESLALYRQIGDRWSMARVLNNLGETLASLGQPIEARRSFFNALQTANEVQAIPLALDALMGLAALQAKEAAIEPALELLAHIRQHPTASQETKDRAEKLRLDWKAQLTSQQLEAFEARVQARNFEGIVKEILDPVARL